MANLSDINDYLTPGQVADLLMVSAATVRNWAEKGELKALVTPGGHRRFLWKDIRAFAFSRGLTLIENGGKKLRILVVDDNKPFADMLNTLLGEYTNECEVKTVYNGFDAGIYVSMFKPDILLLDLMMPGLDGFDVCRRLKASEDSKGIRVIALTGFASDDNVKQVLEAGAEACLEKPVKTDQLLKLLGMKVHAL